MRRRWLTCFFLILLYCGPALPQSSPDSDFQIWNETTLAFPVMRETDASGKTSDKLSLLLIGTLRLGQNRLFPVDARVGTGFDYKINDNWSFSPTYVYRRGEPLRNRPEYEHRLRFDLSVGKKWKTFSLRDRNRIEYRVRNSRSDSVRYRNRLTFAFPVKKGDKEIFSPFIHDEVYYDITSREFSTNEFAVGITRKLNSSLSSDIYYLRRDFRSGQIRHVNGVAVNLKIRID